MPYHKRIQGIPLSSDYSANSIKAAREFQFRSDDVIVASYPKTGSTLLQEIVYLLVKDHEKILPYTENITERTPLLEYHGSQEIPLGIQLVRSLWPTRVIKTHLPFQLLSQNASEAKIICILRNPKDTCVSMFKHYQGLCLDEKLDFNSFRHLFFKTDKLMFGNIFDHYESYWHSRSLGNILILFYEDLLRDKKREIAKIAKFLKVEISTEKMDVVLNQTKFQSMKKNPMCDVLKYQNGKINNNYGIFSQGTVGYWPYYFSQSDSEHADQVIKDRLTSIGLFFHYGKNLKECRMDKCDSCSDCVSFSNLF